MQICMDWRAIKFDWNRARAFLVTAEEGSLSRAAKALGMSQPTLGRQVSALEKELGVALFERSGRGLELTPSGMALLEHVRTMADAANYVSLTATGRSQALEGTVRLSTSEVVAALLLPPLVRKLRLQHPHIHIDLIASNDMSDLKRREADIALRFYRGRPADSHLIARKLDTIKGYLYATPEYLRRIGNPATPEALEHADFLGPREIDLHIKMLGERGINVSPQNFRVSTESSLVQWELTKAGVGIGYIQERLGDAEPRVTRVLPDLAPFCAEMWLVAHRELRTSRRIRAVFDFFVKELANERA